MNILSPKQEMKLLNLYETWCQASTTVKRSGTVYRPEHETAYVTCKQAFRAYQRAYKRFFGQADAALPYRGIGRG